jgi:isopenicillin-N epimerase
MPGSAFAPLWPLDPAVDYLNHGSFGACPSAVLDEQARLRWEMEREPVDFLWRDLPRRLAQARQALGAFVGAAPDDLAWVSNATAGVNAVLRSLELRPGDELLTTDHVYGACRRALEHAAARAGARVVVAVAPFPLAGEDDVLSPLLAAVTPATRLALIDQVTSPTGLVLPVARLVRELAQRGVDTLVDAAHALGMLPLDLDATGAAYTTANAHKWLCAPKGAAFLHVRQDRQRLVHPLSISHAYDPEGSRFREEFDWTGTDDPTPFLTIPTCLRYLGSLLPGGWPELMAANRTLALEARGLLCAALGQPEPAPAAMIGALASVPLPAATVGSPAHGLDHEWLLRWCRARGVESCFMAWHGGVLVRVSPQLYNARSQYERLAGLLREALGLG